MPKKRERWSIFRAVPLFLSFLRNPLQNPPPRILVNSSWFQLYWKPYCLPSRFFISFSLIKQFRYPKSKSEVKGGFLIMRLEHHWFPQQLSSW